MDSIKDLATFLLPESSSNDSYVSSIKRLMTNPGYVLLLVTYGLNVGVFYAISTHHGHG